MLSVADKHTYYQALLAKQPEYEGIFYVGVKTTRVFCRPTCPARKPKFENCEFYRTAQEALLAAFRPCKRCRPLSHPNHMSKTVQTLVNAVEAEPEKRWREEDFRALVSGRRFYGTSAVQKTVRHDLCRVRAGSAYGSSTRADQSRGECYWSSTQHRLRVGERIQRGVLTYFR